MSNSILVLDDDEALIRACAERLERMGWRWIHCEDPDEALGRVRSGGVDLIVVDPLLRGDSGVALLEHVCGANGVPAVPVIVTTRGGRTPELYGRALELGVREFLTKPVTPAELAASIDSALRERAEAAGDAEPAEPSPSGALAELALPELLARLHARGFTGVVVAAGGDERVGVQLRNGSPVAVSSSRGKEPLADFLLRTRRIEARDRDRLVACLEREDGPADAQDAVLELGLLDEEALDHALRQRAEEPLLRAFGWETGSYRLLPDKRLKATDALEVQRATHSLLFDGGLHHAPGPRVESHLARRGSLYASPADPPGRVLQEVTLTETQRQARAALRGDRTVSELLAAGALDARGLYALILGGLVELHVEPILLLVEEADPEARRRREREERRAGAEQAGPTGRAPEEAPAAGDGPRPVPETGRAAELSRLAAELADQDDFSVLGVEEDAGDEDVARAHDERLGELGVAGPLPSDPRLAQLTEQIRARLATARDHLADAESRRGWAEARREEQKARAASEEASRALEAESWFRKGERFLRARHFDQAVEAFGMSTHLDPEEGEYVAHLGYALYLSNPDDDLVRREAMEQIARGIKLSPERPMPHVYLGRIFKALGDLANARKMFTRASRKDPDCHPALQELRLLQMRREKEKSKGSFLGRLRRR